MPALIEEGRRTGSLGMALGCLGMARATALQPLGKGDIGDNPSRGLECLHNIRIVQISLMYVTHNSCRRAPAFDRQVLFPCASLLPLRSRGLLGLVRRRSLLLFRQALHRDSFPSTIFDGSRSSRLWGATARRARSARGRRLKAIASPGPVVQLALCPLLLPLQRNRWGLNLGHRLRTASPRPFGENSRRCNARG